MARRVPRPDPGSPLPTLLGLLGGAVLVVGVATALFAASAGPGFAMATFLLSVLAAAVVAFVLIGLGRLLWAALWLVQEVQALREVLGTPRPGQSRSVAAP